MNKKRVEFVPRQAKIDLKACVPLLCQVLTLPIEELTDIICENLFCEKLIFMLH
jgi:hypothetical protein